MRLVRDPQGTHLYPFKDSVDLVRSVGRGKEPAILRMYRPERNVAFGRRDQLTPQFEAARAAVQNLGFEPLVRPVGGHAAAYHEGCLVVDYFHPEADSKVGNLDRFSFFGELFVEALESLGVAAGVGELPGEYCPGEYSVFGVKDDGARIKLVGTAQRVVAGAWWFSSGIVVENPAPIIEVTEAAYDALELPLNPATIGAVTDVNPEITVEDVEDAILEAYCQNGLI